MRILVTGTSCVGKSTFIKDFVEKWPMYEIAKKSYRDEAKKRGIKLNKQGDIEGQRVIQEILLDQLEENKDKKYVIYDRGPLDNLVYSIWHNAKGEGNVDDLFIEQSLAKTKRAMSHYDIIFFIPLTEKYPVEIVPDEQRDIDPIYRQEIDHLFKGIMNTYVQKKDTFFPLEDCPAVIEIFGDRQSRVSMAGLYINDKGDIFSESDSLITDVNVESDNIANDIKQTFNLI